jgi:hypothetical protein
MTLFVSILLLWFKISVHNNEQRTFYAQESETIIKKTRRKNSLSNPIVIGEFKEYGTGIHLPKAQIYFDSKKLLIESDSTGRFITEIPNGEHYVIGICYSYITAKPKPIQVVQGDSIVVDFRLRPVDELLK